MSPPIPSFPWCLYVVCAVTVKVNCLIIIKHNCSLCKMNHFGLIHVQKAFFVTPVCWPQCTCWLCSKDNSNLGASLWIVRGASIVCVQPRCSDSLSVTHIVHWETGAEVSVSFCRVGWLRTLGKKHRTKPNPKAQTGGEQGSEVWSYRFIL